MTRVDSRSFDYTNGQSLHSISYSAFLNLVEQNQRILCSGLLHGLNNSARHRADISTAMTANFGFVVETAE